MGNSRSRSRTTHHYHHSSAETMKRLENDAANQRRAHERQMKEMELKYKAEQERMKNERIKDSKDSIRKRLGEVTTKVAMDEKALTDASELLGTVREELDALEDELKEENIKKRFDEDLEAATKRCNEAKTAYDRCYEEISATITKTGQSEANILQFLGYMKDLINATASTKAATNQLEIEMKTNGELLQRYCESKLAVSLYFQNNEPMLSKYIETLAKEDMKYLDDLICADEEEFKEDIIGMLTSKDDSKDEDDDDEEEDETKEAEALKKWFHKTLRLPQYYEAFVSEGCDSLNDLNDDETFTDDFLKDELKISKALHRKKILKGIKKLFGADGLPKMHVRKLKAICLKPKNTWVSFQAEKIAKNKQDLLAISPVLAEFFGRINGTVKKAQQMLEYPQSASTGQFNEAQLQSIQLVTENENKEEKQEEDANEEEEEKSLRENMGPQSECKIFSESDQKWYDGTIMKITTDDQGEWLTVAYRSGKDEKEPTLKQIQRFAKEIKPKPKPLYNECRALAKATVSQFHVVDSLLNEYKTNDEMEDELLVQDPRINALQVVGGGVENNCVLIFKNQAKIRQSVVLANDILSLRPANMRDAKTKALWKAVDKGVVNIFDSALDMIKVSAQYFSFFLKFRSSFGYFMSCYQDSNKETSLLVATEYLQDDIRKFVEFQKQFTKQVNELSDKSSDIISQCVEHAVGDKGFKSRQEQRDELRDKYEAEKNEFMKQRDKLQSEMDQKFQRKFKLSGDKQKAECLTKFLPVSIEGNKRYIKELEQRLSGLESV